MLKPALGGLLLLAALEARGVERVLAFHADLRIGADGAITVTEIFEVQAERSDLRRGLVRHFPTSMQDRRGARLVVPFEVERVTRNGEPELFAVERRADAALLRIVDRGRERAQGKQVYALTYRTAQQVAFLARHDELRWSVNGKSWRFAFDSLTAEVTLPQPVPAAKLRLEAYIGVEGARGRDYSALVRDGRAAFRVTRPLRPAESMTIIVAFPKGIVTAPSPWAAMFRERKSGSGHLP